MTAEGYTRIPIASLMSPYKMGLLSPYHNFWWVVDREGNALMKGPTPMCGVSQDQIRHVLIRVPGTTLIFVPWAFVPINLDDWDDDKIDTTEE